MSDPLLYEIRYTVRPDPDEQSVDVTLHLRQSRSLLRELRMPTSPQLVNVTADGDLETDADEMRWMPPASGGQLHWRVRVAHLRNSNGYDAWLGPDWGLFRAEDIIPRAATRTLKGAKSTTQLIFDLPRHWSVVTQYYADGQTFTIKNPARRFDQPSGWLVMGNVGVRRETIAGMRVAVAGPVDNAIRRLDTLALLHWTLPELERLLPELPRRLTIVSAGEPMWRGGLSAPQSLFVHAERPLISENATSTLLHEVMHIALGISAERGYDWIVEGFAEYYSLQLLKRSGTISASRYQSAMREQADWAATASTLCRRTSTGATTALAVTVMAALDHEIGQRTKGRATLDDVLQQLQNIKAPVTIAVITDITTHLTSAESDVLHIDKLPGCRNYRSKTHGT